MDGLIAYQLAVETALSLRFLLKVAVTAKEKSKKPKPPPAPVPPPQPETGYTIELLSIQFCNGKEGSLPLREDYHKNQSLPEWSSSCSGEAVCAYEADRFHGFGDNRVWKTVSADFTPPQRVSDCASGGGPSSR